LKLQQEKLEVTKDKSIHQALTVEIAQECHTQENLCFNEENRRLLENAVKESLSDYIKYKQQLDSLEDQKGTDQFEMVSTMVAYYHKNWSNSSKALEEVDGVQVLADETS
jgi:hypothetical protein